MGGDTVGEDGGDTVGEDSEGSRWRGMIARDGEKGGLVNFALSSWVRVGGEYIGRICGGSSGDVGDKNRDGGYTNSPRFSTPVQHRCMRNSLQK